MMSTITVDTISALKALTSVSNGDVVIVQGYAVAGDGGGGSMRYESSSSASADDGIIFQPTSVSGRFIRLYAGPINVLWFGADRTGSTDVAAFVRKAQVHGNVFYPAGTYLQSTVDVRSSRVYYGEGAGLTVIKKNNAHATNKSIFAVSTYDTDGSGHATADVEDVTITAMTLDFNFSGGWVASNPPIQFRATGGYFLRRVTISDLAFKDSAAVVQGPGDTDAWCINTSGDHEDTRILNCTSYAASHQFVAGGGVYVRRYTVTGNSVYYPTANGITCTSINGNTANVPVFEDITIANNTIIDPQNAAIFVGYDPTSLYNRAVTKITIRNILISENIIRFGDRDLPTRNVRAVYLTPGEAGMKNVQVINNIVSVVNWVGSEYRFVTFNSEDYGRGTKTTAASYTQPATGANVDITLTTGHGTFNGGPIVVAGSLIAVQGAGIYQTVSIAGDVITATLMDWFGFANPTDVIASGKNVTFLGGLSENLVISGNTADMQSDITGNVDTFAAQRNIKHTLNCSGNFINANVSNNEQAIIRFAGNVEGGITLNSLRKINTGGAGAIKLSQGTYAPTGITGISRTLIFGNYARDMRQTKTLDRALNIDGTTAHQDIIFHNFFGDTTGQSIAGTGITSTATLTFGPNQGQTLDTNGYPIVMNKAIYGKATLDFDLMSVESQELTITGITGITLLTAKVLLGVPSAAQDSTVLYDARVTASGTVTVRAVRIAGTTPNPGSGVFEVWVFQ